MIGQIDETGKGKFIRCAPGDVVVKEQDVLDLIARCGEIDSNRVLLLRKNLADSFFDLKTGLAGAAFQKFSNYGVKAAIVVDYNEIASERFRELMSECNKGNQIRFFNNMIVAEKWLTA
jgi:PadR family transcriptional regulator, regulatory protein AphA